MEGYYRQGKKLIENLELFIDWLPVIMFTVFIHKHLATFEIYHTITNPPLFPSIHDNNNDDEKGQLQIVCLISNPLHNPTHNIYNNARSCCCWSA